MARAIRPTLLLLLAAAAITMAVLLTGALGSSAPTAAGAPQTTQVIDRDNVQAGDQTAPDSSSAEQENGGENESADEPAGEAQPGHEDPQGRQVDHQCPPDCAPGELP